MQPIDIIVIITLILIVGSIIGSYIYKKHKNLPTGECACCAMKNKRMIKKIKKIKL